MLRAKPIMLHKEIRYLAVLARGEFHGGGHSNPVFNDLFPDPDWHVWCDHCVLLVFFALMELKFVDARRIQQFSS